MQPSATMSSRLQRLHQHFANGDAASAGPAEAAALQHAAAARICVYGSAVLDVVAQAGSTLQDGTSVPGKARQPAAVSN